MISVIICSVNDDRFTAVSTHLSSLLKDEAHEIIRVSDARSLSEGYTRGIARSRGDYLVFCHDDIEILAADFAVRVKEHLARFDLIGVAGTSRLINGRWLSAGPPYVFGQIAQPRASEGFDVNIYGVGQRSVGQIQAVDGLFFAVRRKVADKIQFDEKTFDGFHLYDLDFSFAAYLAGFKLGVVNDIPIIHASSGNNDESWWRHTERFRQKYAGQLQRQPPRPFAWAWIQVRTKAEVLEVMKGGYPGANFQMVISV